MAVWSSGGNGWGNGTNVATDQNPGRTQTSSPSAPGWNSSIEYVYAYGSPIAPGQKVQWEIIVHQGGGVKSPWWFLQTALETGVASGNGLLISLSYNQGVALNGTVAASTIYDPEGDETNNGGAGWPGSPIPAAPSWWIDGTVITCLCDRVANEMTFIIHGADGSEIGGHTYGTSGTEGPFSISSFGSTTVYPFCLGWWIGGFQITINGGGAGQTLQYPQAGYTNLDGGAAPGTGMTAISTPVSSPNPVTVNAAFQVAVNATGGPFSSAGNVLISAQLHGATPSYIVPSSEAAGATVTLSNSNMTATFSGLKATVAAEHDIQVYDSGNKITSPVGTINVNAAVQTTAVAVNSPAVRVSPFVWAGATSRTDSISRTTAAVGAWMDFYVNASSAPAVQLNLSNTGGTSVLYDYLIGGAIAQQGVAATGNVLNITGLAASGANQWIRLYLGSDAGTLSPVTVTGMTIDSASSAGTAPAAKKSILFIGDGNCQPYGFETVQGFVYLIAQSLGLGTWDVTNSSYGGNGWITASEGALPYDEPSVTSRWNELYPGGPSNLDSTGVISAFGATSTPPNAIIFFLGAADCNAAASTTALTTAITASMAQHRAATSPATALIICLPFGLYDTTAYPTGLTYLAAINAGVTAANAAGSNVTVADPGSAFGISMRTGGFLQNDNQTPTAAGQVKLAATYTPLILPLLTVTQQTQATPTFNVPSPLNPGQQTVNGNFINGTNPPNFWVAWSPSPYIITANAVLATISGSSWSASINLTAPTNNVSGGKTTGNASVPTLWWSTTANQSVTTVTNPTLGIITVPSIADQLQASPVSVQVGFNYLPTPNPTTQAPGENINMSLVPTGSTPVFSPLSANTALPQGAAITVPASIPNQQTKQFFEIQVGFNYVPNQANLYYTPVDVATTAVINGTTVCPFSAGLSNAGTITWDSTGQLATFKFFFNTATTWAFQIFDQSGDGVVSAAVSFVTQAAAGGGGTSTVPTPGAPLTVTGNAWSAGNQVLTVTLANSVLGTFDLQFEDTTYSPAILSAISTFTVNNSASAASATVTVPTPSAPIALTSQTNGSWTAAPGNWAIAAGPTTQTLTVDWSDSTVSTDSGISAGATILSRTQQIYTIYLWTPPQLQPNVSTAFNFEFLGGAPTSIDYTTNAGANWITASAANVGLNTATGAGSLTLPTGLPAGTYTPGQFQIRDTNVNVVTASCGQFVVSAFSAPAVVSGAMVMYFQAANPNCVRLDSNGNVSAIYDLGGTGRHMSLGPTYSPPGLGTTAPTTPLVPSSAVDVLDATPVGPLAPYLRTSGIDGLRSLVQMTPTLIADNALDPKANFFSAGDLNAESNVNNPLIQMFDTSNMEVGTQTIVQSFYLNSTVASGFGCGLIWGRWPTTSTATYISIGRWHNGSFAAQFYDSASGMFLSTETAIGTSQWLVTTLQRNGTNWQYRVNGGTWVTATITQTGAYNSTNCYWGGSVANYLNQPGGNSFPNMGDWAAYTGALSTADLGNLEAMVGGGIGNFTIT